MPPLPREQHRIVRRATPLAGASARDERARSARCSCRARCVVQVVPLVGAVAAPKTPCARLSDAERGRDVVADHAALARGRRPRRRHAAGHDRLRALHVLPALVDEMKPTLSCVLPDG